MYIGLLSNKRIFSANPIYDVPGISNNIRMYFRILFYF